MASRTTNPQASEASQALQLRGFPLCWVVMGVLCHPQSATRLRSWAATVRFQCFWHMPMCFPRSRRYPRPSPKPNHYLGPSPYLFPHCFIARDFHRLALDPRCPTPPYTYQVTAGTLFSLPLALEFPVACRVPPPTACSETVSDDSLPQTQSRSIIARHYSRPRTVRVPF